MITTLLIVLGLLIPMQVAAENELFSELSSSISSSCVSFDYSYRTEVRGTVFTGKGNVTAMYPAFRAEGNGFLIVCDGETKWTSDISAKEMVIEQVSLSGGDISSNPALLLYNLEGRFRPVSETGGSFGGRKVTVLKLESKDLSYVKSMVLYIIPESMAVTGAELTMEDGSLLEVEISSFIFKEKCLASIFRIDEASLSNDYIITDLR